MFGSQFYDTTPNIGNDVADIVDDFYDDNKKDEIERMTANKEDDSDDITGTRVVNVKLNDSESTSAKSSNSKNEADNGYLGLSLSVTRNHDKLVNSLENDSLAASSSSLGGVSDDMQQFEGKEPTSLKWLTSMHDSSFGHGVESNLPNTEQRTQREADLEDEDNHYATFATGMSRSLSNTSMINREHSFLVGMEASVSAQSFPQDIVQDTLSTTFSSRTPPPEIRSPTAQTNVSRTPTTHLDPFFK